MVLLAVAISTSGCGTAAPKAAPSTVASASTAPGDARSAAGPDGTPAATATGTPTVTARPDHVLVAIFENKDSVQMAGNAQAPYFNTVIDRGALLVNARGVAHPSQPNYLALFSGANQSITDDRCFAPLADRPNLGRQLIDAGRTFAGYSEALPSVGYTGCTSGRYAAKHNPWVHFADLPASTNQPFSAFPTDFAALPTVAFVVPDLCDDMHDCPIATGDGWARQHLDAYLAWAETHNSVLIITFDENDGRAGNTILTVFAGAGIKPGRYDEPADHYRVLRTIENLYQLAPIGAAAAQPPLTDIWR